MTAFLLIWSPKKWPRPELTGKRKPPPIPPPTR